MMSEFLNTQSRGLFHTENWDRHFQERPAFNARIDGQRTTDHSYPLRDVAQSEAVAIELRGVKARTVIADAQNHFTNIAFELDLGAPRAGMFQDIVQAFLHDAVKV